MERLILQDDDCWRISGVRNPKAFFRAIPQLVPDATHAFLEGAPAPGVLAIIAAHSEPTEYEGPVGTIWSWPQKEHRFTVRASPALFASLSHAAARHAEPEICSHLHVYRDREPLVQWFDAFIDPILVSKAVPRERVDRFCADVGGALSVSAR